MSELYECSICCETENRDFRKITSKCTHPSIICVECVRKQIEEYVINKQSIEIQCLINGCKKMMERHDIKDIATEEVFEKYDALAYRKAIEKIPNFRWCKVPCGAGQIHLGKDKAPVVICESCDGESCYTHNVIWHKNQSCKDYENNKAKSDFATDDYILRKTKACPGCSIPIEKDKGCDHITCTNCRYEFCWLCLHKHPRHKATCRLARLADRSNFFRSLLFGIW